jgi:hypothetical protein
MSVPCKFERSLLSHDEYETIRSDDERRCSLPCRFAYRHAVTLALTFDQGPKTRMVH